MTQFSQEWFMEMAKLIKARDHALQMIERWQVKAKQAEESIATLSEGVSVPTTEPAPVQE